MGKTKRMRLCLISIGVTICLLGLWACQRLYIPKKPQSPGSDFLIIGHRGAPNHACENTLESFAEAVRRGANALELDLSMTQDGYLVLWHDWVFSVESVVRPVGACTLVRPPLPPPVHTIPLATFLREYGYERNGEPVQVSIFEEFVRGFADETRVRFFFLDLKIPAEQPDLAVPLLQRAVTLLQRHGALHKAIFLTPYSSVFAPLSEEAQRWQRTTGKHVEVALDTEGPQVIQISEWPSAVLRNQEIKSRFALWGEPIANPQLQQDFLLQEIQRRNMVNAARSPRARMRFIVWTINNAHDLCALVGMGVDGIMTDEPALLHSIIQEWKQPGSCAA